MKFVARNSSKTSVLNQVKVNILFKTQKQNIVNRIISAISAFFSHISLISFSYFFNILVYSIHGKHIHFKVIPLRYEIFIHKFCKGLLSRAKRATSRNIHFFLENFSFIIQNNEIGRYKYYSSEVAINFLL